MDTMADWETGYVTAELYSKRYFKKDAPEICLKSVSYSMKAVKTMGGLTVLPDCTVEDIMAEKDSVLILPGAECWNKPEHAEVIKKGCEILKKGGTVCAICGATVALANAGLLDGCRHTSNGAGFLEMFAPGYKGSELYCDVPAVEDKNLITAGTTAALDWAKLILKKLEVFDEKKIENWYGFFKTGKAEYFFKMMEE